MARTGAWRYILDPMKRLALTVALAVLAALPAPLAAQNREPARREAAPPPPRPVPPRPQIRFETSAEARGEYDRCLARAARDPEGAYEDAMNWARARGGGDPALHCAAIALYAQSSFRMSAAAFTELAETTRDRRPGIRANLVSQAGHAWMIAGVPANALAAFDAALDIAPDEAIFHADRAEALSALGQDWDAIDALNRASELEPRRGETYAMRAAAYRKVDTLDLALEDANRAVDLAPKLPEAWLERGIVKRLKNDKNGARRDFREVLLLDADGAVGDAARENIERMELDSGPPVGRRR
jgi:tetratricopeptide (TPR) repeat protein